MKTESFCDVMQQLPDGVIVTDVRGRIIWVNAAMCALLACTPEQLLTHPVEDLLPQEELLKLVGLAGYIEGRDMVRDLHMFLCGPDGTRASIVASIARARFLDGELRVVILAREAGAREEALAESTRWAAAEQNRADELVRGRDALANALQELQRTQRALMDASRVAGMAQVATGILHNVGNVLNGVNVASQNVSRRLRELKIPSLQKLVDLIHANEHDLAAFLKEDKRGRAVVPFLLQLVQYFTAEQSELLAQMRKVEERIEYIKLIVQKQQEYAKTVRVTETIALDQLVKEAVSLNNASLMNQAIEITVEAEAEAVTVDRAEVVHILLNLLSNAKHALYDVQRERKLIAVSARVRSEQLVVSVRDNGVGIAPENRMRMFTFGFTTKKDGHGFGLHDAANAARRMHGSLVCSESAPDAGATFVLTLPRDARAKSDLPAAMLESGPPEQQVHV